MRAILADLNKFLARINMRGEIDIKQKSAA
jgi:hypothetical protein